MTAESIQQQRFRTLNEGRTTLERAVEDVLAQENKPAATRQYLLRVHSSSSKEKKDYIPVVVGLDNPEDRLGVFLKRQEEKLEFAIANPDKIVVSETRPSGQQRKKGETRQARESKLAEYKFELAVLRGGIMAPITVIEQTVKDKDGEVKTKYIGYSISRENL